MAINTIIQAFLAAAEQGQRDYQLAEQTRQTQESNRIQQEQFSARQKQEADLLAQRLQMDQLELNQRKTIADAAHKLQQDQFKLAQQKAKLGQLGNISQLYGSGALKIPEKQTTTTVPYAFVNGGEQVDTSEPDYDAAATMLANLTGGDIGELSEMVKMIAGPEERRTQEIEKLKALSGIKIAESGQIAEAQAKAKSPFDLKLEEAKQSNRMAIETEETARAKSVAAIRGQYQLQAAAIKASKSASTLAGESVSPEVMRDVINADLDTSSLNQLGSQKYRQAIMQTASKEGIKILTKDEKKMLMKGQVVSNIFDKVKELANLYEKEGWVQSPRGNREIANLQGEIDSVISNAARVVAGEVGVLTQQDIVRIRGLIPTYMTANDINKRRVNDFKEFASSTFAPLLYTMGEAQHGAIVNKYGLGSLAPKFKPLRMSDEEIKKLGGK